MGTRGPTPLPFTRWTRWAQWCGSAIVSVVTASAVASVTACQPGTIGEPVVDERFAPGANPSETPDPAACVETGVGPAPLRRLTRTEYENTVSDLFAVEVDPTLIPADAVIDGFDNRFEGANISQVRADRLLDIAESVARLTIERIGAIDALLPCARGSVTDRCIRDLIVRLMRRAYRRPPSSEEIELVKVVYDSVRLGGTLEDGVGAIIESLLMAPQFHFKLEYGDSASASALPEATRLTPYEIATRMSYLLWSSTPDDALLDAASGVKLTTPEGIEAEARRMLAERRGRSGIGNFTDQWLDLGAMETLEKDTTVFPEFDEALRNSMHHETHRFVEDVLWDRRRGLTELLTSRETFVDERLARLYGVDPVAPASGFVRRTLPETERRGFLTQASFLSSHAHGRVTSPVRRGLFVRSRILCQDLPAPPNDVVIVIPEREPDATNRDLVARHTTDPACSGCHHMMDPLGFGFEMFDAVGHFQTNEHNGLPVSARGEVLGTKDLDGAFDGALELVDRLASSEQVERCMVVQAFRYTHGRRETELDQCALDRLRAEFAAKGEDILELMVAMTKTPAFLHRPGVEE